MDDYFKVIGLRKEVDERDPLDAVCGKQLLEIARQCSRIATHDGEHVGPDTQQLGGRFVAQPSPWRIGHNDVRLEIQRLQELFRGAALGVNGGIVRSRIRFEVAKRRTATLNGIDFVESSRQRQRKQADTGDKSMAALPVRFA